MNTPDERTRDPRPTPAEASAASLRRETETLSPVRAETTADARAAEALKREEMKIDLLWKQYALETDLFKHYLELLLKFNTFYYVVTGAIVSFYFTKTDVPLARYALLLPIVMSLVFGVLFGFAVALLQVARQDIFDLRDQLKLKAAPELNVLGALLASSVLLLFTVAGALLWFFFPNLIVPAFVFTALVCLFLWILFG